MENTEKIRVFIAVRLPDDISRELAEIVKTLAASRADVKWVVEDNFHVTLKFLGYVDDRRLREVCHVVESAVAETSPFDVCLAGTGAFPTTRRPRVIWVGVSSGVEELRALAERVEDVLEPLGFAREAREFSAHITLGRVRSPQGSDGLSEAIEQLKDRIVGSFRVESVAVMRSELRRSGPIYSVVSNCEAGRT